MRITSFFEGPPLVSELFSVLACDQLLKAASNSHMLCIP
jgi:hypothetical protein